MKSKVEFIECHLTHLFIYKISIVLSCFFFLPNDISTVLIIIINVIPVHSPYDSIHRYRRPRQPTNNECTYSRPWSSWWAFITYTIQHTINDEDVEYLMIVIEL